jgi:hypothetical protein
MEAKKLFCFALLLLLLNLVACKKTVIWDEVISSNRLQTRIEEFNKWYSKIYPNCKVEARLTDDPDFMRIGVFAKDDIKEDEAYLKIDRTFMMFQDGIYKTEIEPIIKKVEERYGWDDYVNLIFYLLHEMKDPNSEWKPYLDLLPRQPTTLAYKYWERKKFIEEKLHGTATLSKKENI